MEEIINDMHRRVRFMALTTIFSACIVVALVVYDTIVPPTAFSIVCLVVCVVALAFTMSCLWQAFSRLRSVEALEEQLRGKE